MPIQCDIEFSSISEKEFYELDHLVMGLAFDIHNELGRLLDESIYRDELMYRFEQASGLPAAKEVPINVSFGNFKRTYYMDLVLNLAAVYELKTVSALNSAHRKQVINYLLLVNTPYGKLVNMRPSSVEHLFVSTKLTEDKRRDTVLLDTLWQELDERSALFKQVIHDLLLDWGAFLDLSLYHDAACQMLGGEETLMQSIVVQSDTRQLGSQRLPILSPGVAFKLSAITDNKTFFRQHLKRFLEHTTLHAIQWINFNHHEIEFTTLINKQKERMTRAETDAAGHRCQPSPV